MTIVQSDTLAKADGVLVRSICLTSNNRTRSCDADASAASSMSVSKGISSWSEGRLTVDGPGPKLVNLDAASSLHTERPTTLIRHDHAAYPDTFPIVRRTRERHFYTGRLMHFRFVQFNLFER